MPLKRHLIEREEDEDAGFEVEEQNGVLNVLFEDPPGKFVITPNTPVRQIWISALSTSFKLDWDAKVVDVRAAAHRRATDAARRSADPGADRGPAALLTEQRPKPSAPSISQFHREMGGRPRSTRSQSAEGRRPVGRAGSSSLVWLLAHREMKLRGAGVQLADRQPGTCG